MMKRIGCNLDDIRQTTNGWYLCFSFNCTVVAWPRTQWELQYKVFINGLGLSVFFLFVFVSGHVSAVACACGTHWTYHLSQLMRLWYLSHRRPAKAQASLRIRAVSPDPSLFAHMKYVMVVENEDDQKSDI